jgi:hypothetical protein
MANEYPVQIENDTGEVSDLPSQGKRYRTKLDTMADCRREMARVYREARSGTIDPQDATKFTWCLQAIGKVIESSDIETRIEALEAAKKLAFAHA